MCAAPLTNAHRSASSAAFHGRRRGLPRNAAAGHAPYTSGVEAAGQPQTITEFIEAIRAAFVCAVCGRYVGSLGMQKYLPPPYPVALDKIPPDDEVAALAGFEWYMLRRLREGNFTLRHPQLDGRCSSLREWAEAHADDDDVEDE